MNEDEKIPEAEFLLEPGKVFKLGGNLYIIISSERKNKSFIIQEYKYWKYGTEDE